MVRFYYEAMRIVIESLISLWNLATLITLTSLYLWMMEWLQIRISVTRIFDF